MYQLNLQNYQDLVTKGQTIADINIATVADYCCLQVYATFQLVAKLQEELKKFPHLHKLLVEVEQPLEQVLAEMEYTGVAINSVYLQELYQQLDIDLGYQ
jgi:DNA polymerase-1